ncbi:MAG: AbrB/MazE/SpoVT family DNA-binding domain-containing protein [Acidobacteria bacterium]|mgnify:FL=1|nr:MAG: AbrB/MazE/SpoVT family DNA-binding domain-containing protein [Acidobacteriota bacterium]REK09635.1 MAG: AbrB/MazE/SpoVT family DNA-binding domain-containing protein [Acidobacteriota bacterium]
MGGPVPSQQRVVRLFRNGVNQAIRIPRDLELDGEEAVLRKEGDRLIIEPVRSDRLLRLLASLEPIDAPFPDVDRDLPALDEEAV